MNQPKLSVIILTLEKRRRFFERLMRELTWQQQQLPNMNDVEIVVVKDDGEKPIGQKRNEGVQSAKGLYVAYFDDDDQPTPLYLKKQLDAAYSGADAGEFNGLHFSDCNFTKPFVHSNRYTHWYEDQFKYFRNNNHLNVIKRDIVLDIMFPAESSFGEDGKFSEKLYASGRIKQEYPIKEILYLYFARSIKVTDTK